MRRLYDQRPKYCDVAIECIPARNSDGREEVPEQNVVYAHRAVLAARTQYGHDYLFVDPYIASLACCELQRAPA
jgi:hypothetical protein